MTISSALKPEFSRPAPLERLGDGDIVEEITANAEERVALAERLGLRALDRLTARLRLRRGGGKGVVHVSGRFEADITQACVISLEPVTSHLAEDFTLSYTLEPEAASKEIVIEADMEDPPEPVGPDGLDLGEAVTQLLFVAVDPYPHAPDVNLADTALGKADWKGMEAGPFAALKSLKGDG